MRYFSLFSGIGGFELGIHHAMPGSECIGYSEIDKYADAIYRYHFNHRNYGDARRIISSELPDFDLLVAGFPCQSFSVAGRGRGFQDSRGTLFFEIARICADKRPGYILLENVEGLVGHGHGETFQRILGILSDIGYILQWQVLNSRGFGVPQNRRRVFIIGHLRGRRRPEVFPVGEGEAASDMEESAVYCLDANYAKGPARASRSMIGCVELTDGKQKQGQRVYSTDGISATITSAGGGLGAKTGLYLIDKTGRDLDIIPALTGGGHSGNHSQMALLCSQLGIRRLTPLECERLQGFPDGWTRYGTDDNGNEIELSDMARYKCLGNAVTVNVVKWLVVKLSKQLSLA